MSASCVSLIDEDQHCQRSFFFNSQLIRLTRRVGFCQVLRYVECVTEISSSKEARLLAIHVHGVLVVDRLEVANLQISTCAT